MKRYTVYIWHNKGKYDNMNVNLFKLVYIDQIRKRDIQLFVGSAEIRMVLNTG